MKIFKLYFTLYLFIMYFSSCTLRKEYEIAISANTIDFYENFNLKFPNSKYISDVNNRLVKLYEERAWSEAVNSNTISSFTTYINKYNSGRFVQLAKENIEKIRLSIQIEEAWMQSSAQNSIESYELFINLFPESKHLYEARYRILKLKESLVLEPIWNDVKNKNTYSRYFEFYTKYPSSSFANLALIEMNSIELNDWKKTCNINTVSAYKEFEKKYPNGNYFSECEKKIIDLEVEDIFKGDHGELPQMNKNNNASGVFKTVNNIEIYNNTRYTLTIRYSGNESKKIIMAPYNRTNISLKNGNYKITASVDASSVKNYAGIENLTGSDYKSEFTIQTRRFGSLF